MEILLYVIASGVISGLLMAVIMFFIVYLAHKKKVHMTIIFVYFLLRYQEKILLHLRNFPGNLIPLLIVALICAGIDVRILQIIL